MAYVVFGGASVGSGGAIELSELGTLNGSAGFVMNGAAQYDYTGRSVSGAGDVNGDGFDDLLIGAYGADPNGTDSGAAYVVFGGASVGSGGAIELSELSTLNGSAGFVMNGAAEGDVAGDAVSGAGDVNGDGFADLLVGAPLCRPEREQLRRRRTWCLAGRAWAAALAPSPWGRSTAALASA